MFYGGNHLGEESLQLMGRCIGGAVIDSFFILGGHDPDFMISADEALDFPAIPNQKLVFRGAILAMALNN